MNRAFLFFLSWVIVAYGQPAWAGWLGPIAACLGYALFWKALIGGRAPRLQRFLYALGWYFCVQLVQLSWMSTTLYHGVYILFVYGLLCLLLAAQFGFLSLFVVPRLSYLTILALASLWTLLEWSRLFLFCGFTWNPAGLALSCFVPSMQLASVGGIWGLSFWVMLTNLMALRVFSEKKSFLLGLCCALFPYLFGWGVLAYHCPSEEKKPLRVALVQTGLLPTQKVALHSDPDAFISPFEQWRRIFSLLKRYQGEKLDLVILPEAVSPFTLHQPVYPLKQVKAVLEKELFPWQSSWENNQVKVSNAFWAQILADFLDTRVLGGWDLSIGEENYNAACLFTPTGQKIGHGKRYAKRVLVPLAEYLPFSWCRKWVANYGVEEFFSPGKEGVVFAEPLPFTVAICYEETVSSLLRKDRLKGAELFIGLTNDGWYPFSRLAEQHLEHARLRAVENGVPLLRACNTGVTAAVDQFGRTVARLGQKGELSTQEKGVLELSFCPESHRTLYMLWGDKGVVILSSVLWVVFLIWNGKEHLPLMRGGIIYEKCLCEKERSL